MFALAVLPYRECYELSARTKRIDEFHLKLRRTEKELYEEFLKAEEVALVLEMQHCLSLGGEIRAR